MVEDGGTNHQSTVVFDLDHRPAQVSLDYKSCSLVSEQLWQEIESEDALNWLSTLGGAYSNLGEHSQEFAVRACENAYKQMIIALKSQPSPSTVLKCWLFVAMSLMQRGSLKESRKVIQSVYQTSRVYFCEENSNRFFSYSLIHLNLSEF